MSSPILLCTDGSDPALAALRAGLAVVRPEGPFVILTVVDDIDPTLATGTGMAGGVMSPGELDDLSRSQQTSGEADVAAATAALGLADAERIVLRGEAAGTICRYAEETGAAAIVIGSRGHGGIRRALLGSVSDHVVRNAPCPVVTFHPQEP